MIKKFKLRFIMVLLGIAIFACIQPNNEADNDISNNPVISALDDQSEGDGLLSKKDTAIIGFNNAVKFGLIKMIMNEFPNDYMQLKLADIFLVEDNSSNDFFVVVGEKTDGSIAVMSSLNASSGEVLELFTNSEDSDNYYNSNNNLTASGSNKISSKNKVRNMHAEFIRDENSYDRLLDWKWVVELNEKVSTSAGDRSVLLVSPIVKKSNGKKAKISVFNSQDEESRYLSNVKKARINKKKSYNYYKSSSTNPVNKDLYKTMEIE